MESIATFTDFLRNFKVKYRRVYDRSLGVPVPVQRIPGEGERQIYLDYLRKMRLTSQTNLNLDAANLSAYPPSKKLFTQLINYPQEIIPIMDQVLKDMMIAVAEEDMENDLDGMQGDAGEEEINEIIGKVYKVRPFGIDTVNMRELNPGGLSPFGLLLLSPC